jgi:hypothetical protein
LFPDMQGGPDEPVVGPTVGDIRRAAEALALPGDGAAGGGRG